MIFSENQPLFVSLSLYNKLKTRFIGGTQCAIWISIVMNKEINSGGNYYLDHPQLVYVLAGWSIEKKSTHP